MNYKKRGVIALVLLCIVVSLSNCEKNEAPVAQIQVPATISFNNDIQPIFYLYCALSGCHTGSNPTGRVNLSYDSAYATLFKRNLIDTITPDSSRLYTALNSPMPPWGRLVNYDYLVILKWMKQGAKNN